MAERPMYTCPFCKTEIVDTLDDLIEHRKVNGVCDQKMAEKYPNLNKEL